MEFRRIEHGSADYHSGLTLRKEVLLQPLGLDLGSENPDGEHNHLHFGLFDGPELVACCMVIPDGQGGGKLRQMAVAEIRQGGGFGRKLIAGVEQTLPGLECRRIVLHARKEAMGFYDRLGYRISSDQFIEVEIPHYRMEKVLSPKDEPAVIVLLGAPNEPDGTLSPIAWQRCERALVEYQRNPAFRILPTGGFGDHFNTAPEPHGHYTGRYLIANGVPPDALLEVALSSHTIDDAEMARPILTTQTTRRMILVTSEFHCRRAERVFRRAFSEWAIEPSCSISDLPADELDRLRKHEAQAWERLPK